MDESRYCGDCGAARRPGAAFCGECGARFAVRATPTPEQRPEPSATVEPPRPGHPRRVPLVRTVAVVLVSVVVAALAGWAAHALPQGSPSHLTEAGRAVDSSEPPGAVEAASPAGSGPEEAPGSPTGDRAPGSSDGLTELRTACGKALDVVPTAAVSRRTVLRVTLEVRPVCPEGEWLRTAALALDLSRGADDSAGGTGAAGGSLASGTVDLPRRGLYVPGYDDPTTLVQVDFGPGTAWSSPESLSRAILDGALIVACRSAGKTRTESGEPPPAPATPAVLPARRPAVDGSKVAATALAALRRQAADDAASLAALEGSWVAQLSSKKAGTYDQYDGRTYGLSDIWEQYLSLRLRYPNVRLLSSSDWHSYLLPGYWVVIAGVPYTDPDQPNSWCDERGIAMSQCYAKKLVKDGVPTDTTRHRR